MPVELTSAAEVFEVLDPKNNDPVIRVLKNHGLNQGGIIEAAYALIADRKDRATPLAGEGIARLGEIAASIEFATGDGISFSETGAVQLASDIRAILALLSPQVEADHE